MCFYSNPVWTSNRTQMFLCVLFSIDTFHSFIVVFVVIQFILTVIWIGAWIFDAVTADDDVKCAQHTIHMHDNVIVFTLGFV